MSFDLPLTAFALESTGAAPLAPGEAHTLTLAAPAEEAAAQALSSCGRAADAPHRVQVGSAATQALTLTF